MTLPVRGVLGRVGLRADPPAFDGGMSSSTRPSVNRPRRNWVTIVSFLAPALLVYGLFVLVPIAQAAWYSLFHWNGLEPLTEFIGLDNYTRALNDSVFLTAVWHNTLIIILSLFVQIPFALWLALLLHERFRGRTVLRLIFFAPYVLSEVITGVVWRLLLYPEGMVDKAFEMTGLGFLGHEWLADRSIVMYTMFLVISWKYFGFHMIILLAGLQGIPRELNEAAAIDGASRWQTVRRVTLPLLGPTLRVSVFLSIIGADPAVRPRLGHHQGRSVQCLQHDGDLPRGHGNQTFTAGLRQCHRGDPVRDLARRGTGISAVRDAS